MAIRPVFLPKASVPDGPKVSIEFQWFPGMSKIKSSGRSVPPRFRQKKLAVEQIWRFQANPRTN